MNLTSVLKRPVITEKAMQLGRQNRYVVEVAASSTKAQIKAGVENYFKVKVVRVRTVKSAGKKKAIVELKSGQKLNWLPGENHES